MEHTKGEWTSISYCVVSGGKYISDCHPFVKKMARPTLIEAKANAQLIAAAPDCHRELGNLVSRIEQGLALGEKLDLEPARKALAKAEGR